MRIVSLASINKEDEYVLTFGKVKRIESNKVIIEDEIELELLCSNVNLKEGEDILIYAQVLATDEIQLKLIRYWKVNEDVKKAIKIFEARFYDRG